MVGLELKVSEYLIPKDVVVGWAGCAFDGIVRLKEEVPIARFGDATVHNEASLRVAVFGDMRVFRRREEAGMMAFANHNKSETRLTSVAVVVVQIITSSSHRCQFLIKDLLVLAFRNPAAVNEDVLRKGTVFALLSIKTWRKHIVNIIQHLLTLTHLHSQIPRPLRKILVNTGHHEGDTGFPRSGR